MNLIKASCLFGIFILSFLTSKSQTTRWFECKYFNQGTDIKYLHNPYTKVIASNGSTRQLISVDDYGITVYNSNGPAHFYKHRQFMYKLENGKEIEMYEGVNQERQYYQLGVTAPIGTSRKLYDSSIIIATRTTANLYGTILLYNNNPIKQVIDQRLSVQVDSSKVLINSELASRNSSLQRIIISGGKSLHLDQQIFELRIIQGNEQSRHYVILETGTEIIIKDNGKTITVSITFLDGGLVRYYCSR